MTTQTQARDLNPELVDALKRLRLGFYSNSCPRRDSCSPTSRICRSMIFY